MLTYPPTITTDRLLLRPFHLEDADRVRHLAGDPKIAATTLNIPHPYPEGAAEKWIARHASIFFEGRGLESAITLKDDETLIGAIGLTAEPRHNRAELGYWTGVPYWGNGYCTEAARAVIRYGFETLGYHKITAHYFSGNEASGRVMEKAGMEFRCELIDHFLKNDQYYSVRLYEILKS